MRPADSALGILGVRTMIYASRDAGFCIPENPAQTYTVCHSVSDFAPSATIAMYV